MWYREHIVWYGRKPSLRQKIEIVIMMVIDDDDNDREREREFLGAYGTPHAWLVSYSWLTRFTIIYILDMSIIAVILNLWLRVNTGNAGD